MNWDMEISRVAEPKTQDAAWAQMAQTGVRSQRASFYWSVAKPDQNLPFDFTATDSLVTLAASHGIRLLPVVTQAPRWARQSDASNAPPSKDGAYAKYLRALIGRYGPQGDFWTLNPTLPKKPIREWQIWNEASANYQWTIPSGQDWALGYAKLLKASYAAIKDADPGARVVLGGLPNKSWTDLGHLYKVGHIHGYFDIAAVHPYTAAKHGPLTIVEKFREVLKSHGDGKAPIVVTESGLPASKGRSNDPSGFQTTDQGMADFLKQTYSDFAKNQTWKQLGVKRIYWYTWASSYKDWIFNYTGLLRYRREQHKDLLVAKPALGMYRQLATGKP